MRRPLLRTLLLGSLLLGSSVLGGCAGGDGAATASSGGGTPAAATGCAAAGSGRPGAAAAGTDSRPTLDVDGDGRPDTVWIADRVDAGGAVRFGIRTASGDEFSADFASASPVERAVLVADVSGSGEFIALAGDGRAVRLWAVSDCALVPVRNAQGQQYTFDLGFTGHGTGVGCADVDGDGVRDLVGLQAEGASITSTIVRLDGSRATNGTSRTIADATPELTDLAHQVTCGDLTLAADGVRTAA